MNHICSILEWCTGILASLIVVFLTQLINEKYFVPRRKIKELISEVNYILNYYANIIANPGEVETELEVEASNELRKASMKLMAFIAIYPRIKYGKITHMELGDIGSCLIGLSNSVGNINHAEINLKKITELRELLHKNNPEAL